MVDLLGQFIGVRVLLRQPVEFCLQGFARRFLFGGQRGSLAAEAQANFLGFGAAYRERSAEIAAWVAGLPPAG